MCFQKAALGAPGRGPGGPDVRTPQQPCPCLSPLVPHGSTSPCYPLAQRPPGPAADEAGKHCGLGGGLRAVGLRALSLGILGRLAVAPSQRSRGICRLDNQEAQREVPALSMAAGSLSAMPVLRPGECGSGRTLLPAKWPCPRQCRHARSRREARPA